MMERRFAERKKAMVAEAQVDPAVFRGSLERLRDFVEPFASCLGRIEQEEHALEFVSGLISDLDRKNTESIAYRNDQDRKDLQNFIGQSNWDHQPLLMELGRQVGTVLGRADAVIVFDPCGFPKKGTESVGVKRQWCGRLGKVDNCQVAIYMGYVSAEEHALVNTRLYLPEEWARNRQRRKKCHVARHIRFKTRHELSLEMLDEMGSLLPHAWITGDDEMGRSTKFRGQLRDRDERYLLAVPSNTTIRDLEPNLPVGHDAKAKTPFIRVDKWRASLRENAWTVVDVRDGEKGPLIVEIVKRRVQARTERRRIGPEEVLVITRMRDQDGVVKHDYYLSNAAPDTELAEFAKVSKAEHRIEECIQRGKSEMGLGDYQVRNWPGWHHHQTLSLIAAWFIISETRRGKKKVDTGVDVSTSPGRNRDDASSRISVRLACTYCSRPNATSRAKPNGSVLLPQTT